MFKFPPDRHAAPYRLTSLRHNPYIGSFHGKNVVTEDPTNMAAHNVMTESKGNPLVGVFRHSPSGSQALGLKGILYQKEVSKPVVLSQLKVPREIRNIPIKRSFLQSLKKIPLKVYSSSSLASKSSVSGSEAHNDDSAPVCSICIEPYVDGVELLTLACSHCFHSECARKWFFQGCLNNGTEDTSFNCPECRQDHEHLVEEGRSRTESMLSLNGGGTAGSAGDNLEISASFYQVGRSLIADGGYDFMSDVGSETTRHSRATSVQSASPRRPSGSSAVNIPVESFSPLPHARISSYSSAHHLRTVSHEEARPQENDARSAGGASAVDAAMLQITESLCTAGSLSPPLAPVSETEIAALLNAQTDLVPAHAVNTALPPRVPVKNLVLPAQPVSVTPTANSSVQPSTAGRFMDSPRGSLLSESTYSDCGVPLVKEHYFDF